MDTYFEEEGTYMYKLFRDGNKTQLSRFLTWPTLMEQVWGGFFEIQVGFDFLKNPRLGSEFYFLKIRSDPHTAYISINIFI